MEILDLIDKKKKKYKNDDIFEVNLFLTHV